MMQQDAICQVHVMSLALRLLGLGFVIDPCSRKQLKIFNAMGSDLKPGSCCGLALRGNHQAYAAGDGMAAAPEFHT